MTNAKLLTITAVVLSLAFGTLASIAAAQQPADQTGQPETGMMGGPGGAMMGMMGMMNQMNRMAENCNRMMESMMQTTPTAPAAPTTPGPEKKG